MKRWTETICILLMVVTLLSCDKAPRGIIPESDMVDLVADLHKADAYIDNYPSQFPDDSTKMLLKQSIFKKHGVTQADYDTSLVWYAHNMDVYTDVYRRVINQLKNDYSNGGKKGYVASANEDGTSRLAQPYHSVSGDSADLWTMSRMWVLPQGLKAGYIPFDYSTDKEHRNGDCYELKYKSISTAGAISALLAVDYSDGGTSYVHRSSTSSGWNRIVVHSDSMRTVSRIYGYFNYKLMPLGISYLDSVQIIRTHLNRDTYLGSIGACRNVERSVRTGDGEEMPSTTPVVTSGTRFTPPHALHKNNRDISSEASPNAAHMPIK